MLKGAPMLGMLAFAGISQSLFARQAAPASALAVILIFAPRAKR